MSGVYQPVGLLPTTALQPTPQSGAAELGFFPRCQAKNTILRKKV
jgi:hypothetical protein